MTACQVLMTGLAAAPAEKAGEEISGVAACQALERGGILYFPQSPFPIPDEDRTFLLNQRQLETAYHKNIAYRPLTQKLTGVKADTNTDVDRLTRVLRSY